MKPEPPKFYATRAWTSARERELELAKKLGVQLTEMRQVEALAYANAPAVAK
jgi:hypothetical protein